MKLIEKYFSDFTPVQLEQFRRLGDLYKEWNEKINVISRKDMDGLYEKHVLHSLSIAAVFEFPAGSRVLDIGTGGGFPGIPLAIFFPEVEFVLVDSISKKIKVVENISAELKLKNVRPLQSRVEELKKNQFDFAVSRAVAPLKDLWNWARPLLRKTRTGELKPGLICLKGGDLAAEISESGTRPRIMPITDIFRQEYFNEKYLLYITLPD
jgi:16S rRNA (guanine527-N7)-methyltransferase